MEDIIKILICDVDGTLTDGAVVYAGGDIESKAFSVKDGLILKKLPLLGIDVVFLTGRESETVVRRAAELGAEAIQGIEDKETVLQALLAAETKVVMTLLKRFSSVMLSAPARASAAVTAASSKALPA